MEDLDDGLKRELFILLEAADVAAFVFTSSASCYCCCYVAGRLSPRARNYS